MAIVTHGSVLQDALIAKDNIEALLANAAHEVLDATTVCYTETCLEQAVRHDIRKQDYFKAKQEGEVDDRNW